MGGKLFNLPRMPRAEYLEREAEIRAYLEGQGLHYRIPRYYGDKADFGDMDVIVPARADWIALREALMRALGITESKIVGHVCSTAYRGLQTDFFAVREEDVESTYNFMSFNDLGNILGRLCRRFNLKYGERGLSWVYRRRQQSHYKQELLVTKDFARITGFLGLDFAQWSRGFASLTEIFDWAVQSPYFSVAPYLDRVEGTMARRAQTRTTIVRFIAYLEAHGIDARPELGERTASAPFVAQAFPEAHLLEQIAEEEALEAQAMVRAAKFNGQVVMRLVPGVEGRALSELVQAFKRSIPDFEAFVDRASEEEIARRVVAFAGGDRSLQSD